MIAVSKIFFRAGPFSRRIPAFWSINTIVKRFIPAFLLVAALLSGAEPESSTIARLRLKASQGVAGAQFNLAEMYAGGYGVAKDPAAAAGWYRKSAEQGYGEAQLSVALAYLKGEGVGRDPVEGLAWATVAAQTGGASLAKFRDKVEQQLGPEMVIAARRRSREMFAAIEVRKRARAESR